MTELGVGKRIEPLPFAGRELNGRKGATAITRGLTLTILAAKGAKHRVLSQASLKSRAGELSVESKLPSQWIPPMGKPVR
jgi:hypothetical protein